MKKAFLHVDLDAFFASVELLDHPEWKGLPVIIGGLPEDRRSVVSTASYEARKYGVHSAMPGFKAYQLCPNGIFVRPRMDRYLELSEKVMSVFHQYSPDVQQISIDEAFIDLTGTELLFGSPEQTALKIKQQVFEETGLTVSAGLASTKYLAKIASEVNKPDGFFKIDEGKEEEFMLNLPLKKVWGIGEKTLASLNSKGIWTTSQIKEKSLSLLTALFGNSTGNFLYNAVRGLEKESFNTEPKNHSISAENTYSYDLTGTFVIETALLELCHTVVWRMHKENLRSSCVSLKIRYDDFSTFTVQEASDRDISSIEDLFDRIKRLFNKKYDNRHGIRLLGVGLYNTENRNTPRQAELFDFGEEKKRKVEEAVFKTEQKLKGIKITKARLLSIFAVLFTFLTLKINAESQKETKRQADGAGSIVFDSSKLPLTMTENSKSIFTRNILNTDVEFVAEGWWKSLCTFNTTSTFGFGSTPVVSASTPIFSSEVDLSLWFLLDKHWYFEADFADEFDTNTIAAGYLGDGFLKEARIANRGIVFPSIYSIDDLGKGIGGGKNNAPGVSFHFQDDTTNADIVLRYDSVEEKTKTWYGKNSVTTVNHALTDYLTGSQYILPSEKAVSSVKNIYVESSTGNYTDSRGRKYKKLDSSQYLLNATGYSVYLSKDAKASKNSTLPAVCIEFDSSYSEISAELGSYGTSDSPGTGFLGSTQEVFNKNLSVYSIPLNGTINGNTVWYIQYPGKFSPYAACYRYDAGIISGGEAAVTYSTTDIINHEYSAILNNDDYSVVSKDFFNTTHTYADIFTPSSNSPLDPEYRFPLCKKDSGIYLTSTVSSDLVLSVKHYTSVSRFDIGTKAVPGTVKVYINGIQDASAVWDSKSGSISLSKIPGSQDKIVARWYEDSGNAENGTITAAAGIKKQFSEKISADLSSSANWSYSPLQEYAKIDTSHSGNVTLSTGFEYKDSNFYFKNTAGTGIETVNTTGKLLVSNPGDTDSQTIYLDKDSGVNLPDNLIPVLNDRSTESSSILLSSTMNGSVAFTKGIQDSQISGYAVPVMWDFDSSLEASATDSNPFWSALSIDMSSNASVLASSTSFSFALKTDDTSVTGYDVYFQLGVDADENLKFEDTELIPTWHICSSDGIIQDDVISSFNPEKSGWQIVRVYISDKDRSLLNENFDGRIIVTSKSAGSGKLYTGPYEAENPEFFIEAQNNSPVFTDRTRIKKDLYSQNFTFTNEAEEVFTLTRYFGEMSFEDYENFNLEFKLSSQQIESLSSMTVTLDRPQKDGSTKKALEIELNDSDLSSLVSDSQWKNLKVNLFDKKTSMGTINCIDNSIVPVRLQIKLKTFKKTTLSLKSLYFSDCKPYITVQDKAETKWSKSGPIVSLGSYSLVSDFSVNGSGTIAAALKQQGSGSSSNLFTGKAGTSFTIANINFEGTAGRSSTSTMPVSSAGHNIKTKSAFLGILSAEESFSLNHDEQSLEKLNSLQTDFSKFKIPVVLSAKTTASSDTWAQNQKTGVSSSFKTDSITFTAEGEVSQKISASQDVKTLETDSYTSGWKEITTFAFDTGKEAASKRSICGKTQLGLKIPFISLSPVYKISTENTYKNTTTTVYSDKTTQSLSIPFTIRKNSFYFNLGKTAGGTTLSGPTSSYSNDFDNLQTTLQNRDWYFKTLPFYDLWNKDISKTILSDNTLSSTSVESLYYTAEYSAGWKRPFYGTFKDFYLPSSATVAMERDIKAATNSTDIYQVKTTLNFNALNIFGSKSAMQLIKLFEQDEYITSITAAVKMPDCSLENSKLLISLYHQDVFWINDKATLKSGFELNYEDKYNCSGKATFIWKRPGKTSFVESIIEYFYEDYVKLPDNITRSDNLNLSFKRATSSSSTDSSVTEQQNYEYKHEVDIKINTYANINMSAGLTWDCVWNDIITLNGTASVGATVKF